MTYTLIALLAVVLGAAGMVFMARRQWTLGWSFVVTASAADAVDGLLTGAWIQAAISGLLTLCCVAAWAYSRAKRPVKTQS